MDAHWLSPAGLHTPSARLPVEGELPWFGGATGWLNSPPLTAAELRGRVVLANFWTYTCINWLRQLPYVRAWAAKYAEHGLVVIGVHTPEFTFESNVENVRRAVMDMSIGYPVAIDSDYAIWTAFGNHYWPALYFADAQGRIRHHHFGEGEYQQSEMVIQHLLAAAGSAGIGTELVSADARGRPPIVTTVGSTGEGVAELYKTIAAHQEHLATSGTLARRRAARAEEDLHRIVVAVLHERAERLWRSRELAGIRADLAERRIDPWTAAQQVLDHDA